MVALEVETAVKSVAALRFLAKLTLAAFGLFDWPLADEASLAIEAGMTAASAEGVAGIRYRHR